MYQLRIYFSTEGVENAKKLVELRNQFAMLQGKSLKYVYDQLGCMAPVGSVSPSDKLGEVGTNRITRRLKDVQDGTFSFFGMDTVTEKATNLKLWTDYVKRYYPGVSVDVIGDANGAPICEALLRARSQQGGKA